MRKYIYLLLIPLLFLFGCYISPTYEYSISFYLDGIKLDMEPKGYNTGDEFNLPIVKPSNSNLEFDGWYDNDSYTGEKITKVNSFDTGNKKFFARSILKEKEEYTIKYYINSFEVIFDLSSYYQGDTTILPIPELSNNQTFDGWYLYPDLSGDKITSLVNQTGNLQLFGYVENYNNEEDELRKAFNYDSFKFDMIDKTNGETYIESYVVDGLNTSYYADEMTSYLAYVNNQYRYYFEDLDGWYYLTEEDEDFEYCTQYFFTLDLSEVNLDKFIKVDNYYTVTSDYLDEVGLIFTGYNDSFKSFKLYLENGYISKIEITSSFVYENQTYNSEYLLEFSSFGSSSIELPSAKHYNYTSSETLKIEEVYNLYSEDEVTIEGVITGIYGNNFYISDDTKGILVYMSNDDTFNSIIKIGNVVTVSGIVNIYKTVHQIQNVTSISLSAEKYNLVDIYLKDISQNTLGKYVNDIVNIENLEIVSIPSSLQNGYSDLSFTCKIGVNEVVVFISKHLDSSSKQYIIDKLNNLSAGDNISLYNVHIGYYNNYQIILTNNSEIQKGIKEVISTGIEFEKTNYSFLINSELDDILNQIIIYETFSDGSKVKLENNEYTVFTDNYSVGSKGEFTFTYKYNNYIKTCNIKIVESSNISKEEVTTPPILSVLDKMGYDEYTGQTYGITKGLPSIGNPKVLVIPIEFTDCPASNSMVSDLETAFFGTSEQTGWESLKSYYYKSSYGKLTIDGTVLEPFNTNHSVSYYNNLYKQYLQDLDDYYDYKTDVYPTNVENEIIKSALEYYDNQINYADYDTDADGYIDSIYFVYTTNYSEEDETLWWAYTTEYVTDDYEYYDNVEADFYVFCSYQFLFDDLVGKKVKYNTETIIHETGHLLGLDDYYDYDETVGPNGGIGGGDMMDYNVGDHNAYSKLILGWISPYIIEEGITTLNLNSFAESGDVVILFKKWNNSFFDEYYIIDFYTPTKLNEFGKGVSGLFSISGIRIYHVISSLNDPKDCFSIFELTKYNNSYTNFRLISLIEADGKNDISNNGYSQNSDLFQKGNKFINVKWYNGQAANFNITVNDIVGNSTANITIEYK